MRRAFLEVLDSYQRALTDCSASRKLTRTFRVDFAHTALAALSSRTYYIIIITASCIETYMLQVGQSSTPTPVSHSLSQRLCASQLPRSSDYDIAQWFVTLPSPCRLNLLYYIHTIKDFTENDVLAIKMRCGSGQDEELRAVGVWAVGWLAIS